MSSDRRVIRNVQAYDGDGNPPYHADIVLRRDRIEEIVVAGNGRGQTLLDGDGLAACPGFIDIHGHSDMALAHADAPALLLPFLCQGITTQVVGNCGLGVAPAPVERRGELAAFMSLLLSAGCAFTWQRFSEYLDVLAAGGAPFNVAVLAAHGAIRCAVLGTRNGPARDAELTSMRELLDEAMAAGAFGLSAGLIYPPGMWSDTEELVHLARGVAAVDGLFACHVRGSSELALDAERELLEIGTRTGVRLQHSHHEAFGPGFWHLARQTLAMERAARDRGIDIASDVIPYHAVNTSLLAIFPPWALQGGVARLCERLGGDEAVAIEADIAGFEPRWPPWQDGWAHNLVRAAGWDNIVLLHADSEPHRRWLGQNLTAIAAAENRTPFACAAEIVRAAHGDVMARYHSVAGAPGDDGVLRELLAEPSHAASVDVILKGTGVSHPGGYGAMPRVLGTYARERGWLTLADAVRKITSVPADRLGLRDRGRLRPGHAADIVLFDPVNIGERGTYAVPDRAPDGVHAVIVNGAVAVAGGEVRDGRAGRLLRRVS